MREEGMVQKTVFDEQNAPISGIGGDEEIRPSLLLIEGGTSKTRYRIDKDEMFIGRDLECAVSVQDSKISRMHAKINALPTDGQDAEPKFILTDLGSTNGSFVNGQRISQIELRHRDRISIGSFVFGFFLRDELVVTPTPSPVDPTGWDELTGLLNRSMFERELESQVQSAKANGYEIDLIFFEINHFKKLRETYGYQVGYEVLREVGNLIRLNCRKQDIGARYGSEQFAIILPDTPMERALVQADRLRKAAMAYVVPTEDTAIGIAVSVGLAALEPAMKSSQDLIRAAERALQAARNTGSNEVCWFRNDTEMRLDATGS
jgi:diguanylate cyclase (GGDEF)-like protein